MEKKIIEIAKELDAKLTKRREDCSEGETLIGIDIPVEAVEAIIEYILATEKAKAPCTAAEEAKNTAFDHTIEMMRSSDYKERFKSEYYQTKIRYDKLKKFNTRIEAAGRMSCYRLEPIPAEPKHDCPPDLLREQQRVMGEYLHLLEVRAEIEHIEL